MKLLYNKAWKNYKLLKEKAWRDGTVDKRNCCADMRPEFGTPAPM